jgi:hypothetical protein
MGQTLAVGSRVRGLYLLLVAVALLFVPARAFADYQHRVVLLEAPDNAEAATEVLARVRGELTAAGFEVVLLPVSVEGDPSTISETSARELLPAAVILVLERPAEGTEPQRIELWLSDRLSRRTFVQSLPVETDEAGRGYRRLAVQAVELLKARLAELAVTKEPPKPPPPHEPPKPPPPKPPPPPEPPGVEGRLAGGVTLFQGFEGVETSYSLRVSGGAGFPAGAIGGAPFVVDLGASLNAFGSRSTVHAAGGKATVDQALGTIDLSLRFDRGAMFQPLLVTSAGLYTVGVEGSGDSAHVEHDDRTWSAFTAVGAGLWLRPSHAFALELEAEVGRAWAKTVVRIDREDVAETGSPLLLLSLTAVGIF